MAKSDFFAELLKQLDLRRYRSDVQKFVGDFVKAEKSRKPQVALLLDGPNIMLKEFNIDLDDVRRKALKVGELKIAKAFLNQFAGDKLIEAVVNQGFEPVMSVSEDVDVELAVEAMELIYDPAIDTIVIVTRDSDYLSVIRKAKKHNKKIIVFGAEPGFSIALKNAADSFEVLGRRRFLRRLRRPLMAQESFSGGGL